MPNKLWNISDITTIIVVICTLFSLYAGFIFIQQYFSLFFVVVGVILFLSCAGFVANMFISKSVAQWKLDQGGVKKSSARRIDRG